MENAPFALAGNVPAAGPLERAPRKAWSMGKSRSNVEMSKDPRSVVEVLAETMTLHDKSPLPSGFTLRVKPDRRRVQLPIPGGFDRRRPR
jgi:hypothetical protein